MKVASVIRECQERRRVGYSIVLQGMWGRELRWPSSG